MFVKSGTTVVSPWHDVPLYADAAKGLFNFVCEIPKESKAKVRAVVQHAAPPEPQRWATHRSAPLSSRSFRWKLPQTRRRRPSSRTRRRAS